MADPPPSRHVPDPVAHRGRLDEGAVEQLLARARREVDDGRSPAVQVALALDGELVVHEAYGDAGRSTRFCVFSCTKAVVAAAVWQLLGEGRLSTSTTCGELVPDLGADGPDADRLRAVTLEQLLTHTAGFPSAPLGPGHWGTREGRLARFRRWRLSWEPGSRFEYHPTSAHWVVAEMVEAVEGRPYVDALVDRVVRPLGLPTFGLGEPPDGQGDVAAPVAVGEPPGPEDLLAVFGTADVPLGEVTPDLLLQFGDPAVRAAGVPGAGGLATAADLALLYQGLLHDPAGLWDPDVLADGTGRVRCALPDPTTGVPANRTLGLVLAGDDARAHLRRMGRTVSPRAFGHNGAGGQLAWADPSTGLSFAYTTAGIERDFLREARRVTALASLAGRCAPPR